MLLMREILHDILYQYIIGIPILRHLRLKSLGLPDLVAPSLGVERRLVERPAPAAAGGLVGPRSQNPAVINTAIAIPA